MTAGVTVTLHELISLRAAARGVRLGARRLALSSRAGGYYSAFRGRGLEFDEVRIYQPGDDARSIDWRVTARRGKPHTKLFRDERERPVFILADLHPGMYFGTRKVFKSVLAMRLAALIAWSAEQAGERVGGVVSAADGHYELPPKPRRAGVLGLLHLLERHQPRAPGKLEPGRLDRALARLAAVTHPGSLVLVLSDFLEAGDEAERHLSALAHHNDVLVGLVFDSMEAEPPPAGRYTLGVPDDHKLVVDTGRTATVTRWREHFLNRLERVEGICHRHGLHWMELLTEQDPLHSLRLGLAAHGNRRR